jgi:hypothetical protein
LTTRRVLAVCSDPDRLNRIVSHVRQHMHRVGGEVDAIDTVRAVQAEVIPHLLVVFSPSSDASQAEVAALAARLRPEAQVVIHAARCQLGEMVGLLRVAGINHVIAGDDFETGLVSTVRKLISGDIFGIDKYVPASIEVQCVRVRDFEGRGHALDAVLDHAETAKVRRQVRSAIGQVCEELLMNALYDAPVDAAGQQVFAQLDPRERTRSVSPRPVSLRFAATETQFVIAVRDRFGGLVKETICAYIDKCLHSAEQIDRKTYGAGLGIYLVASAASSLVVNVAYGMATEVICAFDRGPKAPLRHLGFFVHPHGADHAPGVRLPSAGPIGPDDLRLDDE